MMNRTLLLVATTLVSSTVGQAARAAPAHVGVTHGLVKLRPGDAAPTATAIEIDAARNEFEPFQIVIAGGDDGVTGVTAVASALTGPGGATIGAAEIMLYRVGLYNVAVPSNTEGAVGPWPDPLIPGVDAYEGETRNGFPFDVPAGELRSIWVEVLVPEGATPGAYTGTVTVSGTGIATVDIEVALRVRTFALPSTATLKSAFAVRWDVCAVHLGSYPTCGDPGIETYLVLYGRAALDHRISLENVVYYGPDGTDWSRFDAAYAPLLDGTAPTRLSGARQTTLRLQTGDADEMALWHAHFQAEGWLDTLFDYTCDEPPLGCAFNEIAPRAATVQAAGIRTLVTTDIDEIEANSLADAIDIAVPIVNFMHDKGGVNRRADYDAFLASSADKELWMYQSCMSHGCGDGCVTTSNDYFTGWPSYMIDSSAVQNRAMEWLSFHFDVSGELYFETTHMLTSAWDDQCDFSGNGDGTLFYPGTPARIGGSSHIPIESIRLKLVREGMEDYEYLHLLCELGDCAMARAEASALFPAPYEAASASPVDLFAARARLADRIEDLSGSDPHDGASDAAAGDSDGGIDGPDGGADGGGGAGACEGDDCDLTGCGCRSLGRGAASGIMLLALVGLLALLRGRRGAVLLALLFTAATTVAACGFRGGDGDRDARTDTGDGGAADAAPGADGVGGDAGVDPCDCPDDEPVAMFHSCTPPLEVGCRATTCTPDVTDCGEGYSCLDCAIAACCHCAACYPGCVFTGPAQGPLPEYLKLRTSYGTAGESQEIVVQGYPFYIGALFYLARVGDSGDLYEESYPDTCSRAFTAPARGPGMVPVWVSQYGGNEPWVLAGFFTYSSGVGPSCVQPGFPCGDTATCCETDDVPMACTGGRCRME